MTHPAVLYKKTIPWDLTGAAYVDGANDFIILWKVVVPLIKPALEHFGLNTVEELLRAHVEDRTHFTRVSPDFQLI